MNDAPSRPDRPQHQVRQVTLVATFTAFVSVSRQDESIRLEFQERLRNAGFPTLQSVRIQGER